MVSWRKIYLVNLLFSSHADDQEGGGGVIFKICHVPRNYNYFLQVNHRFSAFLRKNNCLLNLNFEMTSSMGCHLLENKA